MKDISLPLLIERAQLDSDPDITPTFRIAVPIDRLEKLLDIDDNAWALDWASTFGYASVRWLDQRFYQSHGNGRTIDLETAKFLAVLAGTPEGDAVLGYLLREEFKMLKARVRHYDFELTGCEDLLEPAKDFDYW